MINNRALEKLINIKLNSINFNDYSPNGLQVEGRENIAKVVTGVTGSQELLKIAIFKQADAIIVHHGYFWKDESPTICGIKKQRLKMLLENEINLYSWHIPLDVHSELGNNVQLATLLDINIMGKITPLVLWGELSVSMSGQELALWIHKQLDRRPLWYGETGPNRIKRVAWCTGSGQKFINTAAYFGIDAFITGEISEQTVHSAHEQKLHFYSAGHHATERGGIRALSEWLNLNYHLDVNFIDIPNIA